MVNFHDKFYSYQNSKSLMQALELCFSCVTFVTQLYYSIWGQIIIKFDLYKCCLQLACQKIAWIRGFCTRIYYYTPTDYSYVASWRGGGSDPAEYNTDIPRTLSTVALSNCTRKYLLFIIRAFEWAQTTRFAISYNMCWKNESYAIFLITLWIFEIGQWLQIGCILVESLPLLLRISTIC